MTETAKTELATREDQSPAEPTSQADALISMIERVALNPQADIDKMERLLQMQERVMERQAQIDFAAAMARMQPELPVIEERGKIMGNDNKVRNTYARWEDINEQVKPVLARHGFSLDFRSEWPSETHMVIVAMLTHESGHTKEAKSPPLPADTSGSKNAIQALGSSQSYGQRYAAKLVLNLTSRGEDDDGQKGAAKTITADQWQTLRTLLDETGSDENVFLKFYGAQSLDLFPAAKFERAKNTLEDKKAKGKGDG